MIWVKPCSFTYSKWNLWAQNNIIFIPFFGHVYAIVSDEKYCTSFQARLPSLRFPPSCNAMCSVEPPLPSVPVMRRDASGWPKRGYEWRSAKPRESLRTFRLSLYARVTIKSWPNPETVHEKLLVPMHQGAFCEKCMFQKPCIILRDSGAVSWRGMK